MRCHWRTGPAMAASSATGPARPTTARSRTWPWPPTAARSRPGHPRAVNASPSTTSFSGSKSCSAMRPSTRVPVPTRGSRIGPDEFVGQAPPSAFVGAPRKSAGPSGAAGPPEFGAVHEADRAGGAAGRGDVRDRAEPRVPGAGVHRAAEADRPAPGHQGVDIRSGQEPSGAGAAVRGSGIHRAAGPRPAAHVLPQREVLCDRREQRGAHPRAPADPGRGTLVLQALAVRAEGGPVPGTMMDAVAEAVVAAQLGRAPRG